MHRKLLIIVGPTAVGKTDYSIETALRYGSPVISCDSRQIYKEMTIGTAVPDASQLAAVKHYFIQTHSVTELYTAGRYEIDALELIERLFSEGHETLVMAGGSGFYVDAVCNGLEDVPSDLGIRAELWQRHSESGLAPLQDELKRLDPECFSRMDTSNTQRVIRALEVCLCSGKPFSSFKPTGAHKRDFEIKKIGLMRPRDVLYDRINRRVTAMIDAGLVEEVRGLMGYRDCTALQTVGYREIYEYIDGKVDLDRAADMIRLNTRHYAKRQMTWWRRDASIKWINLQ